MTTCTDWNCDTDSALGGSTQEWEVSAYPSHTDTGTYPLGDNEAIVDPTVTGFSQDVDPTTQCVMGIFIYILQHINVQPGFVYIRIRFLPIDVPVRLQMVPPPIGPGGGE